MAIAITLKDFLDSSDDCLNECADVYFEAGGHMDLVHVSAEEFRSLMGESRHGLISHTYNAVLVC